MRSKISRAYVKIGGTLVGILLFIEHFIIVTYIARLQAGPHEISKNKEDVNSVKRGK